MSGFPNIMDISSLYVLFSHFRPRNVSKGIFLLLFHKLRIHMHVHKTTFEETVSSSNTTWPEMGKQNVQAKEVHLLFGFQ